MSLGIQENSNLIINEAGFDFLSFPEDSSTEVNYVDGKKEGVATVFSSKRTRIAIVNYKHDIADGLCVFFDENGMKIREAVYENGIHDGWGCEYNNSSVVFVGFYKNGKRYSELIKNEQNDFVEEVRENKTLSYCKYTKDHKRDGLCYMYSDGKLDSGIMYDNGSPRYKAFEIQKDKLFEYNIKNELVYRGDYEITNDKPAIYKRSGDGYEFEYQEGQVARINHITKQEKGYYLISGELLKEYNSDDMLVYEGGFVSVDQIPQRHQKGCVYSSPTQYYIASFDNGTELRREKLIEGNVMVEYNEANQVAYKGEFDTNKERSGKGFVFNYENNRLVDVYGYEKGVTTYHRYHFADSVMEEYEENGALIYKGGFKDIQVGGFQYEGEGELFNRERQLLYSGDWVNNIQEGTGRFYHDGIPFYSGLVVNGVPDGEGLRLNESGDVLFNGCWHNGYIAQEGKYIHYETLKKCGLYEDYSLRYEGDWQNDLPHGEGVMYDQKGNVLYKGSWQEGVFTVSDKMKYLYEKNQYMYESGSLKYVGGWNDCPDGEGSLIDMQTGEELFHGHWTAGVCSLHNGQYLYNFNKSVLTNASDSFTYNGVWNQGRFVITDHLLYDYKQNVMVYTFGDEMKYVGEWRYDYPHGKGVLTKGSKIIANGQWVDGKCQINPRLLFDMKEEVYVHTYEDGNVKYKGGVKNGQPHGNGVLYDQNGRIRYQGKWNEGRIWKGLKWYYFLSDTSVNWLEVLVKHGFLFDVILLILSICVYANSNVIQEYCKRKTCFAFDLDVFNFYSIATPVYLTIALLIHILLFVRPLRNDQVRKLFYISGVNHYTKDKPSLKTCLYWLSGFEVVYLLWGVVMLLAVALSMSIWVTVTQTIIHVFTLGNLIINMFNFYCYVCCINNSGYHSNYNSFVLRLFSKITINSLFFIQLSTTTY